MPCTTCHIIAGRSPAKRWCARRHREEMFIPSSPLSPEVHSPRLGLWTTSRPTPPQVGNYGIAEGSESESKHARAHTLASPAAIEATEHLARRGAKKKNKEPNEVPGHAIPAQKERVQLSQSCSCKVSAAARFVLAYSSCCAAVCVQKRFASSTSVHTL